MNNMSMIVITYCLYFPAFFLRKNKNVIKLIGILHVSGKRKGNNSTENAIDLDSAQLIS